MTHDQEQPLWPSGLTGITAELGALWAWFAAATRYNYRCLD
jgi:hypothetical protein